MKSFCIIGLGSFGSTLAEELVKLGRQVMVLDSDAHKVNMLADKVIDAVIGDPTDETVLTNSGVRNYDCAVNCINENLNDSILVTVILKELGVKTVIARAGSVRHQSVLKKLGADVVVYPEHDMAERLADVLVRKNVLDFMDIDEGYSMAEVVVPEKWIGKALNKLDIRRRHRLSVVYVRNADGKVIVPPDPLRAFCEGDRVSIIGDTKSVDRLIGKE